MTSETKQARLGRRLRLCSYNIQVGNASVRPHHYITQSWKYLLPDRRRLDTLNSIAQFIGDYDIVTLQETDAGSMRTHYVNQTEYLAEKAKFPFWHDQVNRNMGRMAQHSQGLLSRLLPSQVTVHRLPGMIPGRTAMLARYGKGKHALAVLGMHLALGKRTRVRQLDFISELISDYKYAVIMGDLNCEPGSAEMRTLMKKIHMHDPFEEKNTFPSWRPSKQLDHILVADSLHVSHVHVPKHSYSDHLPIATDIIVPPDIHLLS
ncbi:MAG: endonuclease/exonuclease/phosphatase family protein [Gammaproteobacteria bacterium]|nr:MAG: endonuclease/exonuclease/phosphatase family protein [Gammaproteobacteria bacterium]